MVESIVWQSRYKYQKAREEQKTMEVLSDLDHVNLELEKVTKDKRVYKLYDPDNNELYHIESNIVGNTVTTHVYDDELLYQIDTVHDTLATRAEIGATVSEDECSSIGVIEQKYIPLYLKLSASYAVEGTDGARIWLTGSTLKLPVISPALFSRVPMSFNLSGGGTISRTSDNFPICASQDNHEMETTVYNIKFPPYSSMRAKFLSVILTELVDNKIFTYPTENDEL